MRKIFNTPTKKKPLAEDVSIAKLVELTEEFSGAEMEELANRAATAALKRYVGGKSENLKEIKITQQDLLDAIDKVKPKKVELAMTHSIK